MALGIDAQVLAAMAPLLEALGETEKPAIGDVATGSAGVRGAGAACANPTGRTEAIVAAPPQMPAAASSLRRLSSSEFLSSVEIMSVPRLVDRKNSGTNIPAGVGPV